jgi:hypothetical protein
VVEVHDPVEDGELPLDGLGGVELRTARNWSVTVLTPRFQLSSVLVSRFSARRGVSAEGIGTVTWCSKRRRLQIPR